MIESERECPHQRTRLVRDVSAARGIGDWYVECADCWSAGPTADTDAAAVEAWTEIVEVLDVWNSAQVLVSELRAGALAADEAAFAGKTTDAWLL
jgi:hypothetical protein